MKVSFTSPCTLGVGLEDKERPDVAMLEETVQCCGVVVVCCTA